VSALDLSVPQVLTLGSERFILEITAGTEGAIALGLGAVAMLSLGTRLFAPRLPALRMDIGGFLPSRLFAGYLTFLLVEQIAPAQTSGFAQVVDAVGTLKYVFAVLLTYLWIETRRGLGLLGVIIAAELAIGVTGYFSNFKGIFIVVGTACLTVVHSHGRRVGPAIVLFGGVLVVLLALWTSIKPDYRSELNQGTGTQSVRIGVDERLSALGDLIGEVDTRDLADGAVGMLLRTDYTQFLAEVLQYVPASHPHEAGALWGETFSHMLKPRIFFPDKAALLSDSERTMRYTGRRLASDVEGTSISIGYVGESYIDFGLMGALGIPFLLAIFYGAVARHITFLSRRRDLVVCSAVLIVLVLPVQQIEISNIKLLPGMVWRWAVFALFIWAWEPLIRTLVTGQRRPSPLPRPTSSVEPPFHERRSFRAVGDRRELR
jgi:hypothetical protein